MLTLILQFKKEPRIDWTPLNARESVVGQANDNRKILAHTEITALYQVKNKTNQ